MKVTCSLIIFFIISFCKISVSQIPDWSWAHSAQGNYSDIGKSIASDSEGNIYVTGSFASTSITFASSAILYGSGNCSSSGGCDNVFLVKYDSEGNVIWARRAGGNTDDAASCVTVDVAGNIYITGYFTGPSITFGSHLLLNSTISNPAVFIAKYDSSGYVIWARSAEGFNNHHGISIVSDNSANVYVTGNFTGDTITFGNTALINDSAYYSDIFLAKYDSSGNVIWARSGGGKYYDTPQSITVDETGNVYMTGYYEPPNITFGNFVLTSTSVNNENIFIVKYDSSGYVIWAQSAGGIYQDEALSIAADKNGNLYMTGFFTSPTITFGTTVLTMAGGADIFIVKYDTAGNVLWAHGAGGTSGDRGLAVTCDDSSNVYVTGMFYSPTITFGNTTFTNSGETDLFVAKYDAAGNVLWAKSAGGNHYDEGFGITTDIEGNVYVSGGFWSPTIDFGNTVLTWSGGFGYDVFVAKLSSTPLGMEEVLNKDEFMIFPNPTNNSFTIKNIPSEKETPLQIINPLGEIVYTVNLFGKKEYVFNTDFARGTYFVRVLEVVKKLVIE